MEPKEPSATYALRITERALRDINAAQVRLAEISDDDTADEWKAGLYEAWRRLP